MNANNGERLLFAFKTCLIYSFNSASKFYLCNFKQLEMNAAYYKDKLVVKLINAKNVWNFFS